MATEARFEVERLATFRFGTVYGLRVVANGLVHDFQVAVSPKGHSVRVFGEQDYPVTSIGGVQRVGDS